MSNLRGLGHTLRVMACVMLVVLALGALCASGVATVYRTWQGGTGQSTYTSGDQLVYDTGTAFTKVAKGSNGQVWTEQSSGIPHWAAPTNDLTVGTAVGSGHNYRYLRTDGSAALAENAAFTSGRIPYVTTNGLLIDSASFGFDGSHTWTFGAVSFVEGADNGLGNPYWAFANNATLDLSGSSHQGSLITVTNSYQNNTASGISAQLTGATGSGAALSGITSHTSDATTGVSGSATGATGKTRGGKFSESSSDRQAYSLEATEEAYLGGYADWLEQASAPSSVTGIGTFWAKTDHTPHFIANGGSDTQLSTLTGTETQTNKTFTAPVINGAIGTGGAFTGAVTSSGTAGIGYAPGAGGTVTQSTDKATGVTLNKVCGEITCNNATLNGGLNVSFTLTNSTIAAGDTLILNHVGGGGTGRYALQGNCAAGSATITITNLTASNLSDAIVIRFAVVKAVTS